MPRLGNGESSKVIPGVFASGPAKLAAVAPKVKLNLRALEYLRL
jgi:hypothetical protein